MCANPQRVARSVETLVGTIGTSRIISSPARSSLCSVLSLSQPDINRGIA